MNCKIIYTPLGGDGWAREIDLNEGLGEFFTDPIIEAREGVSFNGGRSRNVVTGTEIIRIQRNAMNGGKRLSAKFRALQNHLDRGGTVALLVDDAKPFCYPLSGTHLSGTSKISVVHPPFANLLNNPQSYPAVGDYMILETMPNPPITETVVIDDISNMGINGGEMGIDEHLVYNYQERAFIRHENFFPCLKRPENQKGSIITNERQLIFSLDLTLVPDYETLFSAHPVSIGNYDIGIGENLRGRYTGSGDSPNFGGFSMDMMPRESRLMGFDPEIAGEESMQTERIFE